MEQIDPGQIHLWLARLCEITDSRLLAECRLLLSEEELRRHARFRVESDRHRYLVTRAMVRTVLSKYTNIAPRDWTFDAHRYGKPSIALEHVPARALEFNISRTDGLVVLGIACGRAVGVDVESMHAREIDLGIADRYFAPSEVAALRALPREQQLLGFLKYWTLKESYIKARGMGLSIPLDRLAFDLDDPRRIRLMIHASLQDCAERWLFWQLQSGNDHLMALCAEGGAADRPYLAPVRCWP